MLKMPVDWGSLWLGGFCPVEALGGLPVRGADYAAHPPLDERLTLPADAALHDEVTLEESETTWSERLGGAWVVLVRDAYRARRLLHQAAGIQPGEWVGVPANASHDLAESVKHHKGLPRFLDFDAHLRLAQSGTRFTWTQVVRGLWQPHNATWLDCADTLPAPGAAERPAATLYGLHLPDADDRPGALLVFSDEALYAEVRALRQPVDCPNAAQALAQCERLPELAEHQSTNLAEVRRGLREAAGLVTHEPNTAGAGDRGRGADSARERYRHLLRLRRAGKYARALAAPDSTSALCRARCRRRARSTRNGGEPRPLDVRPGGAGLHL